MEEAKKKLREIFAGYDYDIPEEVKLNLIKEWQKDLDKIKEHEKNRKSISDIIAKSDTDFKKIMSIIEILKVQ